VHFIQNHDQIGNRAFGDRLGRRCSPAAYRAAGALVLLSPHTPLLFMGQEWNASTPFLYFTDHEESLGRAVREGRRKEFASFSAFAGQASPPDPQSSTTFEHSRLRWDELGQPAHAQMLAYHRELLLLRRRHPALRLQARERFAVSAAGDHGLAIDFRVAPTELLLLVSLEGELRYSLPAGNWRVLLSSEEPRFGGDDHAGVSEGLARLDGPGALVLERLPRG
jgi:maltooligosyltrehalose trehalohydrolase